MHSQEAQIKRFVLSDPKRVDYHESRNFIESNAIVKVPVQSNSESMRQLYLMDLGRSQKKLRGGRSFLMITHTKIDDKMKYGFFQKGDGYLLVLDSTYI